MTERGERLALAVAREVPPTTDSTVLREQAAAVLRGRFRYALGIWATVDPLTTMWTSCVLDGFARDPELERAVFENEYGVPDVLKLRDLARRGRTGGAGALSLETGGDPAGSPRFREVLDPRGVTDELRVVLTADGTAWGAVVLLATEGRFDEEDVAALQAIARPLGGRLRTALLAGTATPRAAAGMLVCDHRGSVVDLSPEAAVLLGAAAAEEVPAAVAAAVVRFLADGTSDSIAASGGSWLTLRCARLGGRVLVLVDRIDPHRLADVLIEGAGLTPRERTVLEAVLGGATTRAAAVRLRMSEHTVNDHLKRIFTKFGVGSRAELVARLFTDHYAAPHAAGATPSARGHFLPPPAHSAADSSPR